MTLSLWLIRHAQSTWNAERRVQGWADPPLTDLGRWQARQVAARLADVPLQAIYTSTLARARETAEVIATSTGAVVHPDERLREHGVGDATGWAWNSDDARVRWPHLAGAIDRGEPILAHVPGAEAMEPFLARILEAFAAIRAAHAEGHVAVVSHGGALRSYLIDMLGAPQTASRLRFANASLSLVAFDALGRGEIWFLNDTCHVREIPEELAHLSPV